jgi:AcrR family transcriptional regulator
LVSVQDEARSESRQRVLDAAEWLFMERGYVAISLRDIAESLGIRQASLYYHFPQGKEELYVAVAKRAFARHYDGVSAALAKHATLEEQLRGIAGWFASQPHMCLMGMIHADLPALQPNHTLSVENAAYQGVFQPLAAAFIAAEKRGEIVPHNPYLLAGSFLALLDGLTVAQDIPGTPPRQVVADQMIDLMLNGIRPRPKQDESSVVAEAADTI